MLDGSQVEVMNGLQFVGGEEVIELIVVVEQVVDLYIRKQVQFMEVGFRGFVKIEWVFVVGGKVFKNGVEVKIRFFFIILQEVFQLLFIEVGGRVYWNRVVLCQDGGKYRFKEEEE